MESKEVRGKTIASLPLKSLAGCRIGALGFGRQDTACLVAGMTEQSARIEFIPRGAPDPPTGFDMLILNASSPDIVKRDAKKFRTILDSGIPAIVIGSRITFNMLRAADGVRTWDFIAKPLQREELVWRAANLLSRVDGTEPEPDPQPAPAEPMPVETKRTNRHYYSTNDACPKCRQRQSRPSRPDGFMDGLSRLLLLGPYRCKVCMSRFYRFTWPWAGPWSESNLHSRHQQSPSSLASSH